MKERKDTEKIKLGRTSKINKIKLDSSGRIKNIELDKTGKIEKIDLDKTGRLEKIELDKTGKISKIEFEKIKNSTNKKKKETKKQWIITIILTVAIVLVVLILTYFLKQDNNEIKLKNLLSEMGEKFYKDVYYGKVDKETLAKYKDIGIKVNLDNLERYNNGENKEVVKKFKNKNKDCDKTATIAIIYPEDPYEKDDYRIETVLECD